VSYLEQHPALLHVLNGMLSALPQVADCPEKLQVAIVMRTTEGEWHNMVKVVSSPKLLAATGAAPSLQSKKLCNYAWGNDALTCELARPSVGRNHSPDPGIRSAPSVLGCLLPVRMTCAPRGSCLPQTIEIGGAPLGVLCQTLGMVFTVILPAALAVVLFLANAIQRLFGVDRIFVVSVIFRARRTATDSTVCSAKARRMDAESGNILQLATLYTHLTPQVICLAHATIL